MMETMPHSARGEREKPARQKHRHRAGSLLPGPFLPGYLTQRDDENHFIVIDHRVVRCSPDEYRLLLKLMEHYEHPVPFDELIVQFQDASLADPVLLKIARRKLTCTLSRLRAKLETTDVTIVRVVNLGYLLTHQSNLWNMAHPSLGDVEHDS